MSKIVIDRKPLVGIDGEVTIKQTYGLVMLTQKVKVEVMKIVELTGQETEEDNQTALEAAEDCAKYLKETLQLSDKQIDKFIYNNSPEKVGDVIAYVYMRVEGMSDQQIKDALRENRVKAKAAMKSPKGSKSGKPSKKKH